MSESELTAEIEDVDYADNTAIVQIAVKEDGEWVGDFFADFERRTIGGDRIHVADWATLKRGNGLYVDEEPPFWPVQEVADELNERFELKEFKALNTGPSDI